MFASDKRYTDFPVPLFSFLCQQAVLSAELDVIYKEGGPAVWIVSPKLLVQVNTYPDITMSLPPTSLYITAWWDKNTHIVMMSGHNVNWSKHYRTWAWRQHPHVEFLFHVLCNKVAGLHHPSQSGQRSRMRQLKVQQQEGQRFPVSLVWSRFTFSVMAQNSNKHLSEMVSVLWLSLVKHWVGTHAKLVKLSSHWNQWDSRLV